MRSEIFLEFRACLTKGRVAYELHVLKESHVFDPRPIPVAFSKTVRDVLKWVRTCLGAAAPLPAVGHGRNETCSGEGASSWEELGESHRGTAAALSG